VQVPPDISIIVAVLPQRPPATMLLDFTTKKETVMKTVMSLIILLTFMIISTLSHYGPAWHMRPPISRFWQELVGHQQSAVASWATDDLFPQAK